MTYLQLHATLYEEMERRDIGWSVRHELKSDVFNGVSVLLEVCFVCHVSPFFPEEEVTKEFQRAGHKVLVEYRWLIETRKASLAAIGVSWLQQPMVKLHTYLFT